MEELGKLEKVQNTIHLLQSVGIFDANPDSQQFLAHFFLLLMEDCGGLDVASKCQLISINMSKISAASLSGALHNGGTGENRNEGAERLPCDDKSIMCPVPSIFSDVAMVGLDAIVRSNSTLEDFCRSYFMFHKMDTNAAQSIFRYLPFLSFTESFIYQLDGLNEKLLQLPKHESPIMSTYFDFQKNEGNVNSKYYGEFINDPFRKLHIVLEHHGLLSERIREELRYGEEYWGLERKLCRALVRDKKISIEDVTRAIHLKSFDYRVLNLLLYRLRGEKVNELHMEFLSVSELLVEISDDLFDYEDDVVENNFNILRMFVKYYGASAAPINLAKFISEAEENYNKLLKALGSELCVTYQKRCEEATREGGKSGAHPLGTWHIPPVIEDESRYRTALLTSP